MPSRPTLTGFDDQNLQVLNAWLLELDHHKRELEELRQQVRRVVHKTFPKSPGVNTN